VAIVISLLSSAYFVYESRLSEVPTPTLSVEPPEIVYESFVKGQQFSLNITVANVTDLKAYELKLSFNATMLSVLGIQWLPVANSPLADSSVASGIAWMNVTYTIGSVATIQPITIANMIFQIKNPGKSPLHLYDTTLANSAGVPISHYTTDGSVQILRHDVAILAVTCSTDETYIGHIVNVTVVAKNWGDAFENFTVSVYHNSTLFGSFSVVDLSPSDSATIIFDWNTSDVVAGCYSIEADASLVPYETNSSNNLLVNGVVKVKIVGDVNNDNVVDINDLFAWDSAYGSCSGQSNWNPQADINGDGVVDKVDGALIIENYHNTL